MSDIARRCATYAKAHGAGAYGSPTDAELARLTVVETPGAVVVSRRQPVTSRRRDFTGRTIEVPRGANVATFVACDGDPPDLDAYDVALTHLDDPVLTAACRRQGRDLIAVQITATSTMIGVWGRAGSAHRYDRVDRITLAAVPMRPPAGMVAEARALAGWHDDYPYYSDGTWSALSVRGFDPDPAWGVKPAEMGKAWHAAHPGQADRKCVWTDLDVPFTRAFLESVEWWGELERVRFMRMQARPGGGRLARHTDITDRTAGTRDGAITRWHLPLVTDASITMTVWGLEGAPANVHLAPGWAWYFDQRKPHAVDNPSPVDRIHLVADVIADGGVREMIERFGIGT